MIPQTAKFNRNMTYKNTMSLRPAKIRLRSENNINNFNKNIQKDNDKITKEVKRKLSKINNNNLIPQENPIFFNNLYDNIKPKPFTASASINRTSLTRNGYSNKETEKQIKNIKVHSKKLSKSKIVNEFPLENLEQKDSKNEGKNLNSKKNDKKKLKNLTVEHLKDLFDIKEKSEENSNNNTNNNKIVDYYEKYSSHSNPFISYMKKTQQENQKIFYDKKFYKEKMEALKDKKNKKHQRKFSCENENNNKFLTNESYSNSYENDIEKELNIIKEENKNNKETNNKVIISNRESIDIRENIYDNFTDIKNSGVQCGMQMDPEKIKEISEINFPINNNFEIFNKKFDSKFNLKIESEKLKNIFYQNQNQKTHTNNMNRRKSQEINVMDSIQEKITKEEIDNFVKNNFLKNSKIKDDLFNMGKFYSENENTSNINYYNKKFMDGKNEILKIYFKSQLEEKRLKLKSSNNFESNHKSAGSFEINTNNPNTGIKPKYFNNVYFNSYTKNENEDFNNKLKNNIEYNEFSFNKNNNYNTEKKDNLITERKQEKFKIFNQLTFDKSEEIKFNNSRKIRNKTAGHKNMANVKNNNYWNFDPMTLEENMKILKKRVHSPVDNKKYIIYSNIKYNPNDPNNVNGNESEKSIYNFNYAFNPNNPNNFNNFNNSVNNNNNNFKKSFNSIDDKQKKYIEYIPKNDNLILKSDFEKSNKESNKEVSESNQNLQQYSNKVNNIISNDSNNNHKKSDRFMSSNGFNNFNLSDMNYNESLNKKSKKNKESSIRTKSSDLKEDNNLLHNENLQKNIKQEKEEKEEKKEKEEKEKKQEKQEKQEKKEKQEKEKPDKITNVIKSNQNFVETCEKINWKDNTSTRIIKASPKKSLQNKKNKDIIENIDNYPYTNNFSLFANEENASMKFKVLKKQINKQGEKVVNVIDNLKKTQSFIIYAKKKFLMDTCENKLKKWERTNTKLNN